MPLLAILDSHGVLIDYKTVAKKSHKTTDRQVAVEDECDLPVNKYRWDGKAFMPLAGDPDSALDTLSKFSHAVALGFASLHNAGIELHPDTVEWLRDYEKSIDNDQPAGSKLTLKQ